MRTEDAGISCIRESTVDNREKAETHSPARSGGKTETKISAETQDEAAAKTAKHSWYFAGIDGGGTSTEACVIDEEGRVLGNGRGGPSNVHYGGESQLVCSVREALGQALNTANLTMKDLSGICAALAGAGRQEDQAEIRKALAPVVGDIPLMVAEDTRSALAAAHAGGNGMVIIAGTGSNCIGVKDGRYASAGGWGALLGDEGSAYRIVVLGLRAAIKSHEKRLEASCLMDLFMKALGAEKPGDFIRLTHSMDRSRIAGLSTVVFAGASSGDAVSRAILDGEARELALMAKSVSYALDLDSPRIALVGGCFENSLYVEMLRQHAEDMLTGVSFCRPAMRPSEGAAFLARNASLQNPKRGTNL